MPSVPPMREVPFRSGDIIYGLYKRLGAPAGPERPRQTWAQPEDNVLGYYSPVLYGFREDASDTRDTPTFYYGKQLRNPNEAVPYGVDPRVVARRADEANRFVDFLEHHPKYNPKSVATTAQQPDRIKRCCKGVLEDALHRPRTIHFILDDIAIGKVARKEGPEGRGFTASELRKVYRLHARDAAAVDRSIVFWNQTTPMTASELFSDPVWDDYEPRWQTPPDAESHAQLMALRGRLGSRPWRELLQDATSIPSEAMRSTAIADVAVAASMRLATAPRTGWRQILKAWDAREATALAAGLREAASTIRDTLTRDLTHKDIAHALFRHGFTTAARESVQCIDSPAVRQKADGEVAD